MKVEPKGTGPFRRLPIKTMVHGVELSGESERLLDEAMVRLDVHGPDTAIRTALEAFLRGRSPDQKTS